MNKYKRLGKNSLLVFIGSIGSKLLAILMLPFYTAWLSVENYGDIDLVGTYVSLIMGVVTLCITDAIFRFPQGKSIDKQRTFFSSGLTVVSLSLILFGAVYYYLLKYVEDIQWGVFGSYAGYIYVLLIFSFLQLYLQQFSRSIDRMSVFVVSGIILTFVTAISSLLLVPKWGVDGYIISQLTGFIISSLYTVVSIHIHTYLSYKSISISTIKEMLSYSIPMIPNATLWWILGTSNRLFLEYYHSTDFVGIFAVSNRFPSIITMVFNTFFLSWQISVLEEFKKPDFRLFYNRILRLCFVLLLLVGFFLCLSSYWLIKFFADESYLDAWRYIPFLGLAAVFSSLSTFVGTMFMATKKGIVKKTQLKEYANIRKTGLQAINLRDDDELIEVKLTDNTKDILLVTKLGQCIRFHESDVRKTGRSSMGVIGMNLLDEDEVVGMQLDTQGDSLLIVSEKGLGKITDMNEFTVQHRGGKGIKCYKISEKTGNVVGVKAVDDTREVMLITTEGVIIQIECKDISKLGRITSGVKLINLDENVTVATIAKVSKKPENEKGEEIETENDEENTESE